MLIFISLSANSQNDTILSKFQIVNGDTIPFVDLPESVVSNLTGNPDSKEAARIARLIRNVKKFYPYAKLAGIRFKEANVELSNAKTKRDKRQILNGIEDEINNKYGKELKNLTITQGKILIKLIDRETGNSSYDIVKEMKGMFVAFFYQNFARFWGYDLRSKYDGAGEDKEIETIVLLIQSGGL